MEQQQKRTWQQGLASAGQGLAATFRYIVYGELIVAVGQWVILLSARIAETVMMFAVLWITADFVAPDFVGGIVTWLAGAGAVNTLSNLSLISLSLLPEIILYSAVITTFRYALAIWNTEGRARAGNIAWTALYGLPTLSFLVLTLFTIGSFVADHGHLNATITGLPLVVRCLTSWFYSFVNLVRSHMAHGKPGNGSNDNGGNGGDQGPQPVPPGPRPATELDHAAIAQQVVKLLSNTGQLPASQPVQIDYTAIAQQVVIMIQGQLPQVQNAPIDYQALAREMVALMPMPDQTIVQEEPQRPARIATKTTTQVVKPSGNTGELPEQESEPLTHDQIEEVYQAMITSGKFSIRSLAKATGKSRPAMTTWITTYHPEAMTVKASGNDHVPEPEPATA